jgi:hypothetical protein
MGNLNNYSARVQIGQKQAGEQHEVHYDRNTLGENEITSQAYIKIDHIFMDYEAIVPTPDDGPAFSPEGRYVSLDIVSMTVVLDRDAKRHGLKRTSRCAGWAFPSLCIASNG